MAKLFSRLLGTFNHSGATSRSDQGGATDNGEPKKVIITTSFTTAIRRCTFHLIPIASSITILVINLRGVFIGYDLSGAIKSETINLMFLQLAAKAHEILIVASLGLIVLHAVRHELLFGDGLPLGLVGSGLSFSDFNLFFRREFYGSLQYLASHGNRLRKMGFIFLLILAILTATLAGPSSAVLLVPRSQVWPSASTDVFLSSPADTFWPNDLSGDLDELLEICQLENATKLAVCPAGGYFSLQEHWRRMNPATFFTQNIPPFARLLSGSAFYWPVYSPSSLIPPLYALGGARSTNLPNEKTTLVQPLAATTIVFQQAANDWWAAMSQQKSKDREGMDSLINDRQVRAQTTSAIATVRCSVAQPMNAADKTVLFPTIPFWFDYGESDAFDVRTLNDTPSTHLRFQWVRLPGTFGPASIGGVFQSPWTSDNTSRIVLGCTAQAGWVPTDVRTDSYSFWSGWYPWNITFGARMPRYVPSPHDESLSPINGRIALGDKWLDLLTPRAPDNQPLTPDWLPSTMESILANAGFGDSAHGEGDSSGLAQWSEQDLPNKGKTPFLEAIICGVLVDGISRTGSHRVFDQQGPPSRWQLASYQPLPNFSQRILSGQNALAIPEGDLADITTLHVTMSISGFALRRSLSAFLAMSILLIHGIMALGHTIWIVYDRRTSRSWNSVSELIALAQNSQPAFVALADTAAGIERAKTFAQLAKIRVRTQASNTAHDHVELVFEQNMAPSALATRKRASQSQRRHSVLQPDPWPSLLPLGDDVAESRRTARTSWTWPSDPRRRSDQRDDTELNSRSTSMERLVPRVHLADEVNGDVVRVNHAYG